jgi:hypothetical protein
MGCALLRKWLMVISYCHFYFRCVSSLSVTELWLENDNMSFVSRYYDEAHVRVVGFGRFFVKETKPVIIRRRRLVCSPTVLYQVHVQCVLNHICCCVVNVGNTKDTVRTRANPSPHLSISHSSRCQLKKILLYSTVP